jgi:hypothetical protein
MSCAEAITLAEAIDLLAAFAGVMIAIAAAV